MVAELGRPETPDETAARKAESSRVYRSSQTARNLVAALLITLAVVAVIIFAVPRGAPAPADPIDVAARAAGLESSRGRVVIAPTVPAEWRVNVAGIQGGDVESWDISYVPAEDLGFLRISQGFGADAGWPGRVLTGASLDGTVTIDGVEWTRYRITDPAKAGNITAALSVQAGTDIVLVYGATDDTTLTRAASGTAAEIRRLQEQVR
ncbi:DUF4245 family protein [Microbacterium sp. CJ88]|uniref:DUF4245 family protein n=1 Tax=Microbacterium sp. CJ88 TaxID=3445672 RepID=UPI003F657406